MAFGAILHPTTQSIQLPKTGVLATELEGADIPATNLKQSMTLWVANKTIGRNPVKSEFQVNNHFFSKKIFFLNPRCKLNLVSLCLTRQPPACAKFDSGSGTQREGWLTEAAVGSRDQRGSAKPGAGGAIGYSRGPTAMVPADCAKRTSAGHGPLCALVSFLLLKARPSLFLLVLRAF